MFSTIVVGYDGSGPSADALALGESLAGPETELVVCCVHPREVYELVLELSLREEAGRRLHAARTRLEDRPRTRFEVRAASSSGAGLHDEAERSHADLIVVGSSHRGALGRVIPGSVTRQVLHAPPCAVAVASYGLHLREEIPIREIGVAFDGRPESYGALEAAAALARERHGRLRLVTVVDPALAAEGWAGAWVYPQVRDELRLAAQHTGRRAIDRLGDAVEASLEVVDGLTAQELVLASTRFDLLVMGSRGYGPLRRVLLGTVSGRVSDAAGCPVLIIPRAAPPAVVEPESIVVAVAGEQPA